MSNGYRSWGNHHRYKHKIVVADTIESLVEQWPKGQAPVLPYGRGRSYGDCCLNEDAYLFDSYHFHRILEFDPDQGTICCEGGVSFGQIIQRVLPSGYFIPVVPSTKHITVGGAIANDVHGRDHKHNGTFGDHLIEFWIIDSSGKIKYCDSQTNPELFTATIGGFGLTGFIIKARFKLKKISSPWIRGYNHTVSSIQDGLNILQDNKDREYSTLWMDLINGDQTKCPGVVVMGDHSEIKDPIKVNNIYVDVPFEAPSFLLNDVSVGLFNRFFYWLQQRKGEFVTSYDSFLYQLDHMRHWNRLFGPKGLIQYHFLVGPGQEDGALEIIKEIKAAGTYPYFAIAKYFGDHKPKGMMSFPKEGLMFALDFAAKKDPIPMLQRLDEIVFRCGGSVYPAKDSHMTPEMFRKFFPALDQFKQHIDPKFSSSFWRRVT